jgi:hypothetical protein
MSKTNAKDCVDRAYDKNTKKYDIDKIKVCLHNKINVYFSSCDQFHRKISDAMQDVTGAMTDFKFTEIDAKLKQIVESNKFSLGVFLCDMVLSIIIGPLLGTLSGKLFMSGIDGISTLRSGLLDFEKKSLGKMANVEASADVIDALGELGIRTIFAKRSEVIDFSSLNSSKRPVQTLNYKEFSTGVIVDTFELMYDKILHISDVESISTSSKMTFDASAVPMNEPTPLEFIINKARKYYAYQKRLNDIGKLILQFFVDGAETVDSLKPLQQIIDVLNATFDDSNDSTENNYIEINNLTKITMLTFYFGKPESWATDQDSYTLGGTEVKHKATEQPSSFFNSDPERITYLYHINIPVELKDKLIRNILVPGTKKSFLIYYKGIKQTHLGRTKGAGIDQKGLGPASSGGPSTSIDDMGSEYYTADETAFRQLQNLAGKIYNECQKSDSAFLDMLSKQGLLMPRKK